ncbi:MAG: hypothetical protein KGI27_00440 [Thaumarchaeota archaeon]|nr:hypothetical protein [Nitrososphaerota archaeon]
MEQGGSNPAISSIEKTFRDYIVHANSLVSEESYKHASSCLEKLGFALDDVSTFAGMISAEHFSNMANYWTAGLFISAAINKVIKEDDITNLDFSALEGPADCVGYRLEHGKIVLHGNAGDYIGESMSGGEIAIKRNAGYYVGYNMSGGRITIRGNAGDHLGTYMSGGIIDVKGKIGSISESCRGRVCHRGMLVR